MKTEDKFLIISSDIESEFQEEVNRLLKLGYKIQGINTVAYETHNGVRASVRAINVAWLLKD